MSHRVTMAGGFRIIRIGIDARGRDATIAVLAHELRHALEVLDQPAAVDASAVNALYERIGVRVAAGLYETDAAQTAERRVVRELGRCK